MEEHHKLSTKKEWITSIILGVIIFLLYWYYHYLRKGLLNPLDFQYNHLSLVNKSLALTAIILIGISLAIGPLAHFFRSFKHKVQYRREIGLLGFFFGLAHVFFILVILNEEFGLKWALANPLPAILGTLAVIVFIVVSTTSVFKVMYKMNPRTWKLFQRFVYIAFILVIAHFAVLKYQGMLKWFSNFDPWLPPTHFIALVFVALVLLLRIAVFVLDIIEKRKKENIKDEDKEPEPQKIKQTE